LASVCAQSIDSVLVEEYSIGSFQNATRIVAGASGTLYVLDANTNTLALFPGAQDSPKIIGGFGWLPSSFDKPTGVATDGINVYVSDYGNHRIQRFDRDLNYISSLSTRDTSDAAVRFGYPLDIAMSEFGDLFVLDGENLRVIKFNSMRFFERSFGDINSGEGKLSNPIRLIVTTSRIFVVERTRIAVFDYFGNFLGSIGEGVVSNLNGFTLLASGCLAVSDDTVWWLSREGVLQKSLPLNFIITGESIGKIQDVASAGERLFILSPKKIHVFKMIN
jgi:hypothetical protein